MDGLEFVARIDVEKDGRGELKNVVKLAVEPDEESYGDYLQYSLFGEASMMPTVGGMATRTAAQSGIGILYGRCT